MNGKIDSDIGAARIFAAGVHSILTSNADVLNPLN